MASRGKTVQKKNMFVADFETCDADELYKVDSKTGERIYNQRVWLAGHKNLETGESMYFTSLDDFMEDILARKTNVNREYGFHNLKFDGSFIVPWLLREGYTVSLGKPVPGQFSVLVDDKNNWYSITIQVTGKRRVMIWDTFKLFPTSLEYMPDIYSTPTRKVKEDASFYERKRPVGHKPDEQELFYFMNDLQVPYETLNKHIELFGLRFKKTQASQSFYNFTESFPAWKLRFPPLPTKTDEKVRIAYWGGIAHVPKDKAGLDHYGVSSYDINSSYPHKAAEMKLPYGKCVRVSENEHPDMSKFWVSEALVEFTLKKDKLPCIPMRAVTEGQPVEEKDPDHDKWLDDSKGIVRLTFCNIDYETIQQSYDFRVLRWVETHHWAWKRHREVAAFVHHNNDVKVESKRKANEVTDDQEKVDLLTRANRAKIDNNSFYGKFGEEIIKEGKTPYYEDDDVIWRTDRQEEQGEFSRKYLPVAIAITAWGRQQMVEMANTLGEHFLYCDTDSVHYLSEGHYKIEQAEKEGWVEIDPVKLGAWDHEGDFKRGRYLRAKCYMEETYEGELEATVAGLPADKHTGQFSKTRSALDWSNFHFGAVIPASKANKLRTVKTPTGNKLVPVGFRIKEKETLFEPSLEDIQREYEKWGAQQMDYDEIKETVKQHGHIETIKPGQRHYEEYKQMSRSVKVKYFRRSGLPLDVFADIINRDIADLIEDLKEV